MKELESLLATSSGMMDLDKNHPRMLKSVGKSLDNTLMNSGTTLPQGVLITYEILQKKNYFNLNLLMPLKLTPSLLEIRG